MKLLGHYRSLSDSERWRLEKQAWVRSGRKDEEPEVRIDGIALMIPGARDLTYVAWVNDFTNPQDRTPTLNVYLHLPRPYELDARARTTLLELMREHTHFDEFLLALPSFADPMSEFA